MPAQQARRATLAKRVSTWTLKVRPCERFPSKTAPHHTAFGCNCVGNPAADAAKTSRSSANLNLVHSRRYVALEYVLCGGCRISVA